LKHKLNLLREYNQTGCSSRAFLRLEKFNVNCLLFNSVYLRNLVSMKDLCDMADSKHLKYYERLIPKVQKSFRQKLYDKKRGIYCSTYNGSFFRDCENSSMFLPLFANIPTRTQAAAMVEDFLLNEEKFWLRFPVPTVAADNKKFQPNVYWRGSTWVNINWFLIKGLLNYDFKDIALKLKHRTTRLVRQSGFHEYYSPLTGKGFGPEDFVWSGLIFNL